MATATVTVYADSGDIWDAGTYANIDEGIASYNDSDLIRSTSSNNTGNFKLASTPADFGTLSAIEIQLRARHTAVKGDVMTISNVQVVQENGSTAISNTIACGEGVSFSTITLNPTLAQTPNKTVMDVAKIKFLTDSGTAGNCEVSVVDVIYTYSVSASFIPFPYPRGLGGGFNWLKGGMQ